MYSWVHPVWALSRQTCTPDADPCLSCRGSQWSPGRGCWRDQVEEEGRRTGDNKTRPHLVSYQWSVSCMGAGGFLKSSSPPLQRETDRKYCVDFPVDFNDEWELGKWEFLTFYIKQFQKLRREQNVAYTWRKVELVWSEYVWHLLKYKHDARVKVQFNVCLEKRTTCFSPLTIRYLLECFIMFKQQITCHLSCAPDQLSDQSPK